MSAPVVWLRSRGPRGDLTGDVLHVALELPDDWQHYQRGWRVPLCGESTEGTWEPTGPGGDDWHRHEHWDVCARCRKRLELLRAMVTTQHAYALSDHRRRRELWV